MILFIFALLFLWNYGYNIDGVLVTISGITLDVGFDIREYLFWGVIC